MRVLLSGVKPKMNCLLCLMWFPICFLELLLILKSMHSPKHLNFHCIVDKQISNFVNHCIPPLLPVNTRLIDS